MAELYASTLAREQPAPPRTAPPDLPGLAALSEHERDLMLATAIAADLVLLRGPFAQAGITIAPFDDVLAALEDLEQSRNTVKLALYTLHKQLLNQAWSADFRLGKAYGLGRALADTSLVPHSADAASFQRDFDPYRIAQLAAWLDELATTLPDHSSQAVQYSLHEWRAWAAANTPHVERDAKEPVPLSADKATCERIDRCLREQGRLWRALLSGEKRAEDLLKTDDYVKAAQEVVDSTAKLVTTFLRKWARFIVPAAALFGGLLAVLFVFLNGSTETASVITAVLAAAGLTWKSVQTTLGKILARAEQPIWQRELATAAAVATTILPDTS